MPHGVWIEGGRARYRNQFWWFPAEAPESGPVARVRVPVPLTPGPHENRLPTEE
ncbi:hypothetical protein AB0H51_21980 [Streptomyces griseoluteus]|uniref:hypothetical protein n=1 Tax=Streptomyces griseoluteus TaxID=29306 RepID=UPI0033FD9228